MGAALMTQRRRLYGKRRNLLDNVHLDRPGPEMVYWRGSERDGMDQPGGSFSFGPSPYPKCH